MFPTPTKLPTPALVQSQVLRLCTSYAKGASKYRVPDLCRPGGITYRRFRKVRLRGVAKYSEAVHNKSGGHIPWMEHATEIL